MKGWEALRLMAEEPGTVFRRVKYPDWDCWFDQDGSYKERNRVVRGVSIDSALEVDDILADDWEPVREPQ